MEHEKRALAKNLARFRKQMGLTQAEISDALEIERSRYAHYEKDATPTVELLIKISNILHVTLDELMRSPEEMRKVAESDGSRIEALFLTDLKKDEKQLVLRYRMLSDYDKKDLFSQLEQLLDRAQQ